MMYTFLFNGSMQKKLWLYGGEAPPYYYTLVLSSKGKYTIRYFDL